MTTEKRQTAAEAREQALAAIDALTETAQERALVDLLPERRKAVERAIERAQEARVYWAVLAIPCTFGCEAIGQVAICTRCETLHEARARLDALAEEV